MTQTVLHIDASARLAGSTSRDLSARIAEKMGGNIIRRDLKNGIPQIDETWVSANFTPVEDRTDDQTAALALSDTLIQEIKAAEVLVIGAPIYNFAVPASLKAWVDQIARAGVTFKYTENGPQGLLEGKRAIIVLTSGGTAIGSEIDFASGYMRHIMGFIGITDVEFVTADQMIMDGEGALSKASAQIEALAA
jgi:FMN-dependent NADH-azoreductase